MSKVPPTLQKIGENGLLRRLLPRLPSAPGIEVGPGDDCAVVHLPGQKEDWLVTVDPVIEGIHFLPDIKPEWIGRKAVSRSVSDIAAMGGRPCYLLVSLMAPPQTPLFTIEGIYRGIRAVARHFDMGVLGGDTAQGPTLEVHVTVMGLVKHGEAVLRSGAKAEDRLYVTGTLGGSYLPGETKHLLFTPRIKEGAFLAKRHFASAMMDLSDGIATDLPRLLAASNCGVELFLDRIPISAVAAKTAEPLKHALEDGEDFELLFTAPPSKCAALERQWKKQFLHTRLTCIGRILADPKQHNIPGGGYQHFNSANSNA